MKRALPIGLLLCLLLTVVLLSTLWAGSRHPQSYSEPLTCYEQGRQLICFDGAPVGRYKCRDLGSEVVHCSRT